MKKKLFIMILAAAAMNINAQLVVDSLGRVGIGTDSLKSMVSIGETGSEDTAMHCNANGKECGLFFGITTNDDSACIYGGQFSAKNSLGGCCGVISMAYGGSGTAQDAVGLVGLAGRSNNAAGLLGAKWIIGNPVNFAGVYGSESCDTYPSFSNYSGTYAGYFKGKVRVTNGIYATVLSPSASPSPSGQSGTTILSNRGESVTDKLSQVQAVQFLRYDPTKETKTAKTNLDDLDIDNMSQEELDSLAETIDEEPEPYLSPIQYGLAADQLKAVYPELVY